MVRIILAFLLFTKVMLSQEVESLAIDLSQYSNVRDFCINQDGDEAFFTIQSINQEISQIVQVKKVNGTWKEPELLPFCDEYNYLEPFLLYDQTKLFFVSNRPTAADAKTAKQNFDIWYVKRKSKTDKWSEPFNLGENVNSDGDEFYPTLAENNNLYFTMESSNGLGKDDIYFCEWNGSEYSTPKLLDNTINSEGYEFNAFISRDESFLIYTKYNAKGGEGSGDLYIARKNESNDQWQPAINMGKIINTRFMEYCPFYDSKNHILYFTSKRSNLKSGKFNNFKALNQYISTGENGSSKIYQIKIEL